MTACRSFPGNSRAGSNPARPQPEGGGSFGRSKGGSKSAGVDTSDIHRGNVLAAPGFLSPTYRISGNLRLLKNSPRPLKNWTRVRFHLGTDECLGRVVLLEHDELQPGEHGYVQIVMEEPVVCTRGDRFVIRFYSPVTTIGGGVVIDPHPPNRSGLTKQSWRRWQSRKRAIWRR